MRYEHLSLTRCDPEQLLNAIDGTAMRHRILPGGELRARVDRLQVGAGCLHRGSYGMSVIADGNWPADLITIGCVLSARAEVNVNGFSCPPLTVQLYTEGCELRYRAPPGGTWMIYTIERDRLQQAALCIAGRLLEIPTQGAVNLHPEQTAGERLAASVHALLRLAQRLKTERLVALDNPRFHALLEDDLHYNLVHAIESASDRYDPRRVSRRRQIMARSEEFLRANIGEPFSLNKFTQATGASQRMLEYHFRHIYGVTPQTWYRSMRLNAAHAELKRARQNGERVTDIAMRFGFLHLGRFSEQYRRLFGERPRDTARC